MWEPKHVRARWLRSLTRAQNKDRLNQNDGGADVDKLGSESSNCEEKRRVDPSSHVSLMQVWEQEVGLRAFR